MSALQLKHLRRLRVGSLLMLYTGLNERERRLARIVLQEKGYDLRQSEDDTENGHRREIDKSWLPKPKGWRLEVRMEQGKAGTAGRAHGSVQRAAQSSSARWLVRRDHQA